jgi:membrane-associated phospholipid phosphatase
MLRRLRAVWRLKLLLTVLINLLFWTGYSFLARHAYFPLWTPPLTWLDRVIPFQPEPWAWIYLSQFVVASVLPWLIDGTPVLRRYAIGVGAMSVVCFALFLFFPVASPRMPGADFTGAMKLIATYDGAMNAFPSLHAAFLAYLSMLTWRMFCGRLSPLVIAGGLGWGAAILYATIATRQHYVVDLIAGVAVGLLADWMAWRWVPGVSAAMTMSRSKGVAFQDGCK